MLGYSKVKEDVEGGHGVVVKEAEEVDAEGHRGGDRADMVGIVGGDFQGFVDDLVHFKVSVSQVYGLVILSLAAGSGCALVGTLVSSWNWNYRRSWAGHPQSCYLELLE